jgi:hypothetical protein
VRGAKTTIAVKMTFRMSNKNSLERRSGVYQSSREKKGPILVLKNKREYTASVSLAM